MRLIARKSTYYQERMRLGGYPLFPGAAEVVTAAAGAGLMLGVVSGALRQEVEGALRQAGLAELFKVALVTAEDVALGKPDPEGYRRALEALNSQPPLPERLLHPHEVLAVEDSPAGLAAAAAIGLVTLGVAQTYPPDALRDADQVAASVKGLTLDHLERLYAEASQEVRARQQVGRASPAAAATHGTERRRSGRVRAPAWAQLIGRRPPKPSS